MFNKFRSPPPFFSVCLLLHYNYTHNSNVIIRKFLIKKRNLEKIEIPTKSLTRGIKTHYYFDTRQVCVKFLVVCRRPGRRRIPPRIICSPRLSFLFVIFPSISSNFIPEYQTFHIRYDIEISYDI